MGEAPLTLRVIPAKQQRAPLTPQSALSSAPPRPAPVPGPGGASPSAGPRAGHRASRRTAFVSSRSPSASVWRVIPGRRLLPAPNQERPEGPRVALAGGSGPPGSPEARAAERLQSAPQPGPPAPLPESQTWHRGVPSPPDRTPPTSPPPPPRGGHLQVQDGPPHRSQHEV